MKGPLYNEFRGTRERVVRPAATASARLAAQMEFTWPDSGPRVPGYPYPLDFYQGSHRYFGKKKLLTLKDEDLEVLGDGLWGVRVDVSYPDDQTRPDLGLSPYFTASTPVIVVVEYISEGITQEFELDAGGGIIPVLSGGAIISVAWERMFGSPLPGQPGNMPPATRAIVRAYVTRMTSGSSTVHTRTVSCYHYGNHSYPTICGVPPGARAVRFGRRNLRVFMPDGSKQPAPFLGTIRSEEGNLNFLDAHDYFQWRVGFSAFGPGALVSHLELGYYDFVMSTIGARQPEWYEFTPGLPLFSYRWGVLDDDNYYYYRGQFDSIFRIEL